MADGFSLPVRQLRLQKRDGLRVQTLPVLTALFVIPTAFRQFAGPLAGFRRRPSPDCTDCTG
jgi:hypothetical protein